MQNEGDLAFLIILISFLVMAADYVGAGIYLIRLEAEAGRPRSIASVMGLLLLRVVVGDGFWIGALIIQSVITVSPLHLSLVYAALGAISVTGRVLWWRRVLQQTEGERFWRRWRRIVVEKAKVLGTRLKQLIERFTAR